MSNPRTAGLLNRPVQKIGSHEARLAIKDRTPAGSGLGASFSLSTSDTGFGGGGEPLELSLTGVTLASELPITAAPQLAGVGVGLAAPSVAGQVSACSIRLAQVAPLANPTGNWNGGPTNEVLDYSGVFNTDPAYYTFNNTSGMHRIAGNVNVGPGTVTNNIRTGAGQNGVKVTLADTGTSISSTGTALTGVGTTFVNTPTKTVTAVGGTGKTITSAAHGYRGGHVVALSGFTGAFTDLNGDWTIKNVTTNTFELVGATNTDTGSMTASAKWLPLIRFMTTASGVVTYHEALIASVASTTSATLRAAFTNGDASGVTRWGIDPDRMTTTDLVGFNNPYWGSSIAGIAGIAKQNGRGTLSGLQFDVQINDSSAGGVDEYGEAGVLLTHAWLNRKGCSFFNEQGVTVYPDKMAKWAVMALVMTDSNDYGSYQDPDFSGANSPYTRTSGRGVWIPNNAGGYRTGTGIYLSQSGGAGGFQRAFVLNEGSTATDPGTDLVTIDGWGNLGLGVGCYHGNFSTGFPCKIMLPSSPTDTTNAIRWGGLADGNAAYIFRSGDLTLRINDNLTIGDTLTVLGTATIGLVAGTNQFLQYAEQASVGTAPTDTARVYSQDDGSGNTQLCVKFDATDPGPIVLATQGASGSSSSISFLGLGQSANATRLSFVAATSAAGGIDFGGDTSLFRAAAGVLRTNESLTVGGTLNTLTLLTVGSPGGTNQFIQYSEQASVSTAPTDTIRIYADVSGTNSRFNAIFQDGTSVVLAKQGGLDAFAVGNMTTTGSGTAGKVGLYMTNTGQIDCLRASGSWMRNFLAAADLNPVARFVATGEFQVGAGGSGTFTVTIASPAVFTKTAHGFAAGTKVSFTTTGALPTGLGAGTYYVISAGLTANAFEVSTTLGGSAVNTSGTQSGTHTVGAAADTGFNRVNPGELTVTDGTNSGLGVSRAAAFSSAATGGLGYVGLGEQSATPATPAANRARLFLRVTAGKQELCVVWADGTVDVVKAHP